MKAYHIEGGFSMNQTITAENAPAALGPYCHAKLAGGTLYTSGQLGLIPATGELAQGVKAQAAQALDNLSAVLQAAGMSCADVVKTTVFLSDINDFAAINAIYAKYFSGQAPARSCVQVAALPKGALFEIEAVAVK
jgi:2-iminobutanoate/2-iminopropanoate deaminase